MIPIEAKIADEEYKKYRHLPINWSIPPITKEDLPSEFSQKAVNTVDMFRRKTYDLDYECMIYFDIKTGNIVSCNFSDENLDNEVSGDLYTTLLKGMSIASLHNHPKKFLSPPSSENFAMLSFDFERYELIFSENELWILESKEFIFSDEEIKEIREKTNGYLNSSYEDLGSLDKGYLVLDNLNKSYGDFLLNYLNNKYEKIKLTRRYLDE